MDHRMPPLRLGHSNAADAGLNPRDALDILDIRTSRQKEGGSADLAGRTDAGADVLQYLATHGAPARPRAAVAANPSAPACHQPLAGG